MFELEEHTIYFKDFRTTSRPIIFFLPEGSKSLRLKSRVSFHSQTFSGNMSEACNITFVLKVH